MRNLFALVVILLSGSGSAAAEQTVASPPAGASACSGCHAPAGSRGFLPISGRDAAQLSASLDAFRTGQRPSTVMGRLMKGFSAPEIQAIAAWIAAEK